jgi:hypothetical protein
MLPRKPFPGGVEGREVVSQDGLHQGSERVTAPACLLSASIKPGLGEAPKAMRAWDPRRRAARVASQTGPFHPARRSTLRAPRKGTLLVSERARRPLVRFPTVPAEATAPVSSRMPIGLRAPLACFSDDCNRNPVEKGLWRVSGSARVAGLFGLEPPGMHGAAARNAW